MQLADGILFSDTSLISIWDKVKAGQRLSFDDGMHAFKSPDFTALGQMADFVKRQRSGDHVYFVINRHINPSNICTNTCRFCDFSRKRGDADSYEMSLEEIIRLIDHETREVHIVGSHHPDWPFEYYENIIRTVHEIFPKVHIKAFTASEIDYFDRRWKIPPEQSLPRLKQVGLSSMPGGGAEVFSSRLHDLLFPGKASAARWLEIHRSAHSNGIYTNATLLYGHIETIKERVDHLLLLRELQDETRGFLCFVPLKYQPGKTRLVPRAASSLDDLKTMAISRLLLDNFPHIKAYWVMLGEALTAIALNFGADDVDGTIGQERIAHAATATSPEGLVRERVLHLIRDAGRLPVERNALYEVLHTYGN